VHRTTIDLGPEGARGGTIGDRKIFASNVADAVRIRNDDRGEAAI
jgi:nitrogen regulatory protein PII